MITNLGSGHKVWDRGGRRGFWSHEIFQTSDRGHEIKKLPNKEPGFFST